MARAAFCKTHQNVSSSSGIEYELKHSSSTKIVDKILYPHTYITTHTHTHTSISVQKHLKRKKIQKKFKFYVIIITYPYFINMYTRMKYKNSDVVYINKYFFSFPRAPALFPYISMYSRMFSSHYSEQ